MELRVRRGFGIEKLVRRLRVEGLRRLGRRQRMLPALPPVLAVPDDVVGAGDRAGPMALGRAAVLQQRRRR
eukprot:scaffold6796_cov69-Phaeocystis_antarctica.AAC.1